MSDIPEAAVPAGKAKRPGIVLFAGILHGLSVFFFASLSLFCVIAMIFGSVWGIDDYVTRQMPQYAPPNFSYGLTILFGMALFVFLCFAGFFLFMAIGLLSGKKVTWYLQVGMSMLGLLSFSLGFLWSIPALPIGTVLNIIILFFFFQPRVREFFKV
jgi:hypothetical protein